LKKYALLFIILSFMSAFALADFKPEEKPIRGLNLDTAYVLPQWGVDFRIALPDVTMPLTVGIFDGVQISTRSLLWATAARVPNAGLKWNIAKESDNMPAFSVGGSGNWITVRNIAVDGLAQPIDKVEVLYYNFSAYATKNFGYLTASTAFTYNKVNVHITYTGYDSAQLDQLFYDALKVYTGVLDPTSMFTMSIILHYEVLQNLRLVAEGLVTLDEPYAYYLAFGLIWAVGDNFRLDSGIAYARAAQFHTGLPHLGLGLNF